MISTAKLGINFGDKPLFEDVSLKFLPGECYGLIGANGAGKSTFLKILSGQLESTEGQVIMDDSQTLSFLSQDQFAYDDYKVLETVIMGNKKLYPIYAERMALYAKPEMTDAEGERVGNLEEEFGELDGYMAESDASTMLSDLGITNDMQDQKMNELEAGEKVRVLLAQALFGNPDVLLLDEPTNQLDYITVLWLEKFLMDFKNTVLVVSHDRHFLNKVCTHIADVDFGEIKIYPGNYDFWQMSSELAMQQRQDKNKKEEGKKKELEDFVRRFSANASKSKQATSRKKLIDKLEIDELPVSRRRTPFIQFKGKRHCGNSVLTIKDVSHSIAGEKVLDNISFTVEKDDKIAILGQNSVSKTTLLDIISGEVTPDTGTLQWGDTITHSYFPKDNTQYFQDVMPLTEWLGQYETTGDIDLLRGFLGRMLFSGDDAKKNVNVLSGGEKARSMFSKMMIQEGNVLIFDEPTDHLDLESITSLNTGLEKFEDCLIFTSYDFQLLNSVPNRIIEVCPNGMIDQRSSFDDFMKSDHVQEKREALK
ncbi:ATP-binding cassette domain-containing protein [bacterium]|jgi:ATPase subunit of ABC transporter with duplicated ATPase domains|nr:ATP-binding cassette domain-containing protein [bacterium]